jgi:hypothetical protein
LLIIPPSHWHYYSLYLVMMPLNSFNERSSRVSHYIGSIHRPRFIYEFHIPASHLPTSNHDEPHSHPHQQQITKPLPIRTAALLGTPSKTVLSGTPELVRGLRQIYLTANAGLSFGCSWLCNAWHRPGLRLVEISSF